MRYIRYGLWCGLNAWHAITKTKPTCGSKLTKKQQDRISLMTIKNLAKKLAQQQGNHLYIYILKNLTDQKSLVYLHSKPFTTIYTRKNWTKTKQKRHRRPKGGSYRYLWSYLDNVQSKYHLKKILDEQNQFKYSEYKWKQRTTSKRSIHQYLG